MGGSSSKKPDLIRSIRHSTEDIRSSIHRRPLSIGDREQLHKTLINNSKELNAARAKKSKKKRSEIDHLQKFVSDVSEELLDYNEDNLDSAAIDSHSFIEMRPGNVGRVSPLQIKGSDKNKSKKITIENPVNKLNDIDDKLCKIKVDVENAIKNENNTLLVLQKKKIEILATELELANIHEQSPLTERKTAVEKDLRKYYQKILKQMQQGNKTITTVKPGSTTTNVENLTKLKSLDIVIQDKEDYINSHLKSGKHFDHNTALKELEEIDQKLNSIVDNEKSIVKHRKILQKKIHPLKQAIHNHMELVQNQLVEELFKIQDEIVTATQQKNQEKLSHLRLQLEAMPGSTGEIQTSKLELIKQIQVGLENINQLDQPKRNIQRNNLQKSRSMDSLDQLQNEWLDLERNLATNEPEEAKKYDEKLARMEESIKITRRTLADVMNRTNKKENRKSLQEYRTSSGDPVLRTNVKIYELPKPESTECVYSEVVKKTAKSDVQYIYQGVEVPDSNRLSQNRRSNIEFALEEITKIAERVEELTTKIYAFKGTTEDLEYNLYVASLQEKKTSLEMFKFTTNWKQVDDYKNETMEKINYLNEYLKYKLNQNVLEVRMWDEIGKLEGTVQRFTGSYQNVQYNEIEKQLLQRLKEASYIDTVSVSKEMQQKLNRLLLILKEKSVQIGKVDFRETQSSSTVNIQDTIARVRQEVEQIKSRINNPEKNSSEEYADLEQGLVSKTLELNKLDVKVNPGHDEIKKILDDIESYQKLLKPKKPTVEMNAEADIHLHRKSTQLDDGQLLDQIQSEFLTVKQEVDKFVGRDISKKFMKLEKKIVDLSTRLENFHQPNKGSSLYEKKFKLLASIEELIDKLDRIAKETEEIDGLEKQISILFRRVDEYSTDNINFETYNSLDESLINLKISLEKFDPVEQLKERKITCVNYIEYCLDNLSKKYTNGKVVSESFVV